MILHDMNSYVLANHIEKTALDTLAMLLVLKVNIYRKWITNQTD